MCPVSPSPGKGISVAGIDKISGFKTPPDEGINHIAGLSEDGLDTSTNPLITPVAPTGVVGTGAVINWTTAPASPAGSVKHRIAGSSGAFVTVAEAAGNKTSHAVPLTGLTVSTAYEYTVSQPSPIAGAKTVEFSGRITTLAA